MTANVNPTCIDASENKLEHIGALEVKSKSKIKTISLLILGIISFIVGVIGLILPILPTTPFILLAAYCFMRSSTKFFVWLRYHPKFRNSFEKKGLTKRGKISILAWAWIILIVGTILTDILWIRILLISIGCIKTIVFAKFIRTVPVENNFPVRTS